MAANHARSVLAAIVLGAALTSTGCTAGTGSSSNTPASVGNAESRTSGSQERPGGPGSAAPQATKAQDAEGKDGSGDSAGSQKRPPWCTTGSLSVSLRPGQPAAGSRYAALVLTNSSGTACRTQGWPGLQLIGADGERIPTEAVRDHSSPSRPLTLAPGRHASARLHWTVVPSEGDPADGKCPDPRKLRVIPPDQRTAKSAKWDMGTVCGTGEIDVLPLRADSGAAR